MSKYFKTPFGELGDQSIIPDDSQPDGSVSFEDGYTLDYEKDQTTDPSAKDVPRQGENYLKFVVTEAVKELQEYGFKLYSTDVDYPASARTIGSDGELYRATVANGQSSTVVDPVGDLTGTWLNAGNVEDGIKSVEAAVSGNALTLLLVAPQKLFYRSISLDDGVSTVVSVNTDLTLTVPTGATLGTVDGVQSRIAIVAINNAGTVELACINLAGGVNLDETDLISTVAIGSTADLADVFYSNTARSNVAYRVVGFVESTQTTAGTWATAPSLVQGVGGQALASLSSLGFGQKIDTSASSLVLGVTYYNTSPKPIVLAVQQSTATSGEFIFFVDGRTVSSVTSGATYILSSTMVIPSGSNYMVTGSITRSTFLR